MQTRRDALKVLGGGAIVGSLSGCVQLATRRTSHFRGTPAMITSSSGSDWNGGNPTTAVGVGVEARKSIERFGVEKEIVAHCWGLVYSAYGATGTGPATTITFTTPSIQIAGQELNPIKDLTVNDIANEFLYITELESNVPRVVATNTDRGLLYVVVDDATGKKVLRAFRGAVGAGGGGDQIDASLNVKFKQVANATAPGWDGGTYEGVMEYQEGGVKDSTIRFEKHNGDFVVTFAVGDVDLESIGLDSRNPDNARGIAHPTDDDFTEEMLVGHLRDTNLAGVGSLFDRLASVVDDGAKDNGKIEGIVTQSENVLDDLYRPAGAFNTSSSRDIQFQLDAIDQDLKNIGEGVAALDEDLERLSSLVDAGHERVRAEDFVGVRDVSDEITAVVDNGAKDNSNIEAIVTKGQDDVAEARGVVEQAEGPDAEDSRTQLLDGLARIGDDFAEIGQLVGDMGDTLAAADNYNSSLSNTHG